MKGRGSLAVAERALPERSEGIPLSGTREATEGFLRRSGNRCITVKHSSSGSI